MANIDSVIANRSPAALMGATMILSALGVGSMIDSTREVPERTTRQESRTLIEVARVGGDDDTLLTGNISDLEVSDSAFFVLQPRGGGVVVYNHGGRFIRRYGRQGSGPGEFQFPLRMGWSGRELWVYDDGLRRFQYFDPNGTLIRTALTPGGVFARPLADGAALVQPQLSTLQDNAYPILVSRRDSRAIDTIATMAFGRNGSTVRGARGLVSHIRLPGDRGTLAVAPDGGAIVIVEDEGPSSTRVRVRRFDVRGTMLRDVRVPFIPIPTTAAWYDSVVRELGRSGREMGLTEGLIRETLPRPRYLPPFERVIVSSNGELWLQRMVPPGAASLFLVIGETGQPLQQFEGPPGLRLVRVRPPRAFGTNKTELGSSYASVLFIGAPKR